MTVRAIAQRAGISTGAVYSHYSSLAELAQSLWQAPLAKANALFRTIAEEEPDPLARIERLLSAYADFAHEHPDFLRGAMLFVRPAPLDGDDRQPLESLDFYRLLVDAVTAGQYEGQVRPGDSEQLALGAWATIHGALALPVNLDRFEFGAPREVSAIAREAALSRLAV